MQLSTGEIALAVTAVTVTIGLLAAFFVLIAIRQYRINARRQLQLLNAVLEAQENERRRIAEDMHDGVGQLLAAGKLQTDALRHVPTEHLPERVKQVKEILDRASAEVRNVVHDLVPKKLEQEGLYKAIEELGYALGTLHTPVIKLEQNGSGTRHAPRVELEIYRIAQELVTNAVKHAAASEITVALYEDSDRLTLRVSDNGVGFDADGAWDGNGLRNVRSRVAWLNGKLGWTANQPNGTRFEITFEQKRLQQHA